MCSATLTSLELTGSMPLVQLKGPPVTLESLTELRLGYTSPLELSVFQSTFLVPALTCLHIINLAAPTNGEFVNTVAAFAALLSTFPFTQIEDFVLSGARFGAPPADIPSDEEFMTASVESLHMAFQLLQRLKNARKVRFDNPDQCVLVGLLYPQLDLIDDLTKEEDLHNVLMVLPYVKELSFLADTDDQAHLGVLRYLNARLEQFFRDDDKAPHWVGVPADVLSASEQSAV